MEYCQLRLVTEMPSFQGTYPFGPYNTEWTRLRTWAELNDGIQRREVFERGYLILCLAEVRNRLVAANSAQATGTETRP